MLEAISTFLQRHLAAVTGVSGLMNLAAGALLSYAIDKSWKLIALALAVGAVAIVVPQLVTRANVLGQRRHDAEGLLAKLLETLARSFGAPGQHARANIMLVSSDQRSRKVHAATAYNMTNDPDSDLEIGILAGASGDAVLKKAPTVRDLRIKIDPMGPSDGISDAQRAKVRKSLQSILSAPMIDPQDTNKVLGTIQVDSDLDIAAIRFDQQASWQLVQCYADVATVIVKGALT